LESVITRPGRVRDAFRTSGSILGSGSNEARRREAAVRKLGRSIELGYSTKDNILRIAARHRDPRVAADVISALVVELTSFNAHVRGSRAREGAQFVGERFGEARSGLATSEQRLLSFQESNVRIGNAPELHLLQRRLEREVRLSEELFALLAKQVEFARIEEKRETPVFTVIDHPGVPAAPDRLSPLLAAVLGFILAVAGWLLAEAIPASLRGDPN
jgi:uncharacterized protein involved in exopolysaccharide biosynthesis